MKQSRHTLELHDGNCTVSSHRFEQTCVHVFCNVQQEAVDIAEMNPIAWFLEGLTPALRSECEVDSEGKDWFVF